MLKFIKGNLETIAGIEIFPLISFMIFFIFFLAVGFYVLKSRKEHIDHMGALPLDDQEGPLKEKAS